MGKKGQLTKERIIRESAVLFNTKGYTGTSLSEIIDRCGIRKGGIYNHFENKDEIALAAFDYSFSQILSFLTTALEKADTSRDRLLSICHVYIDIFENNRLEGGCPILNTAIESDDGHPLLKERTQQAMKLFMDRLSMIIVEGMEHKEFRNDIKPDEVSSYFIAIIEGGLMLSKLFDDSKYIKQCTNNILNYIDNQMVEASGKNV